MLTGSTPLHHPLKDTQNEVTLHCLLAVDIEVFAQSPILKLKSPNAKKFLAIFNILALFSQKIMTLAFRTGVSDSKASGKALKREERKGSGSEARRISWRQVI